MYLVAKATLKSGLTCEQLRKRVSQTQAAQALPFDGTATLVIVGRSRRVLSTSGVARALRDVQIPDNDPVFVALPEVTADAVAYLQSLDVRVLRDPPQSVVTRIDDDVTTA
jgi:hypothetical protein